MKNNIPILTIIALLAGCFAFAIPAPVLGAASQNKGSAENQTWMQVSSQPVFLQASQQPALYISRIVGAKPFPAISPRAYLVADLDSGQIFSEKNSQAKLPIASVTKLMTATVGLEHVDPRATITIDKSMLAPYGYSRYLAVGKRFSFAQLLYPMMVESSNDAAQAVSCFLGTNQTLEMMNEKAHSLSMQSTKYVDAHGLSPANVSTVRDLFYLARYVASKHPNLLDITRGANANNVETALYSGMKNKNLVYDIPNFIGGKTGYIPESNYNGLFMFRLPLADGSSRNVAIIILGAQHLQAGSHNLRQEVTLTLNWLKDSYKTLAARLAARP